MLGQQQVVPGGAGKLCFDQPLLEVEGNVEVEHSAVDDTQPRPAV